MNTNWLYVTTLILFCIYLVLGSLVFLGADVTIFN